MPRTRRGPRNQARWARLSREADEAGRLALRAERQLEELVDRFLSEAIAIGFVSEIVEHLKHRP